MKKSRKRLLISSVAMLLVAMLALGTATFAWFTQSTSATANGVKVTASKASTLEISKGDHKWGTTVAYGVNNNMIPASSADGTNWFTANAKDASGEVDLGNSSANPAVPSSVKAITPVYQSTTPQYVFFDQLNVRNGGVSGTIGNITIAVTYTGTASEYVRFALVPCAAGEPNTQVANNTGAFATHVYAKTADSSGSETKALTSTAGATSNVATKSWSTIADFPTTLTAGQEQYFNFYVWFEGQDPECKDSALGDVLDGLTFSINGTPV